MSDKKKQDRAIFATITGFTWFLFGSISLLGVLLSGLLIVHQSTNRLETYDQLTQLRIEQDAALEEHSRLLIERSSVRSYQRVNQQATDQLDLEDVDEFETLVKEAAP